MIQQKLFSVETNQRFDQVNLSPEDFPLDLLKSYGLNNPTKFKSIDKKNQFSKIFIVESESNKVVFRSTSGIIANLLEKQCQVFDRLSDDMCLKPYKNSNNKFVTVASGQAWIAYPYVEGPLFDGSSNEVISAFHRCLDVVQELRVFHDKNLLNEKEVFPHVKFNPALWLDAINLMIGDLPEPLLDALGKDLQLFLIENKHAMWKLIDELSAISLSSVVLTHYDLQHANIVMSKPKPTIIDIEDVYYAPMQIAVSYCAFKLSRHVVFSNIDMRTWVKMELIPQISEQLGNYGIYSKQELFEYSAIRTLNDIAYIFDLYMNKKNSFVLYDLRKKVLNLLEAAELTECNNRVGLN